MEISSKKPVSVLREVIPVVKKKAIDPRFDRSFGHFNEDLFKKTYGFLADTQKHEVDALRKSLRKESDPIRQEHIKRTLNRLVSMKKSKDLQEERKRVVREHRKAEAQLVEQGKAPYFLKKGDVRKLELAQQFEQYKARVGDNADLDKFLEKKRRRKASKQKKYIPRSYSTDE